MISPRIFFSNAQTKGEQRMPRISLCVVLTGLILLGACKPNVSAKVPSAVPVAEAAVAPSAQSVVAPEATLTPPPANKQAAKVVAAPAERSTPAAAGKSISIAGGWVNAGGACDSGASVFFNPDGTYMSEGEKGTWALAGKTLTVTTDVSFDEATSTTQGPDESTGDSGAKAVLTLLSVTDDAARVVLSNGTNANWTRCSS